MLPGVAPPGRGAPGRGPPAPGPGRGPCGRGIGRSTGCALENGLLPTRGGRGRPGLGPTGDRTRTRGSVHRAARAPEPRRRAVAAGAAGAAAQRARGAAGAGAGGGRLGRGRLGRRGCDGAGVDGRLARAAPLPAALAGAGFSAAAGLLPPNASRSRRATGASTVDDADLTNSPCSLSRARTSLLVTPSSLANSCTRALPATTSPISRGDSGGRPRLGFSYDAWSSSELHGVLMFFATCSFMGSGRTERYSTTAVVSGEPVMRNARAKARRRIAACEAPVVGMQPGTPPRQVTC